MSGGLKREAGVGAGVHWFVAWRYLLADPRGFSNAILRFIGACLWVIAGFAVVATVLYPLAHPILAPFRPLPWWLISAISVLSVGVLMAPIVGGRITASLGLALISSVTFYMSGDPDSAARQAERKAQKPWSNLAGIVSGVMMIALLGWLHFLHRPFTEPPIDPLPDLWVWLGGIVVLIMVSVFPPATAWYIRTQRENRKVPKSEWAYKLWRRIGYSICAVLFGILLLAVIGAGFGVRDVLWSASNVVPFGSVPLYAGLGLCVLGVGLLIATAASQVARKRGFGFAALRIIYTGVLLLAALGLAWLILLAKPALPQGPISYAKFPSVIALPILICGALAVLGVFLLSIRYFFTFFSTVSIGGVAIGSMALVIVLSVMGGFENDLRRKILGSNAHVLVTKASDTPLICRALPTLRWRRCVIKVESQFKEYRAVGEAIGSVSGVVASSPYLISEVVIAANNNYANVIIKGVEPETVGAIGELDENVKLKNGDVDKQALARLWPMAEDGTVLGKPKGEDASPDTDDIDGDGFSDAIPDSPVPVDFSGDGDGDGAADGSDDFEDDSPATPPEPIDLSGGDDIGDDIGDDGDTGADDLDDTDGDDADNDQLGPDEGRAIPLSRFPPMVDDDFDDDGAFIRRVPPLVAILPGTLVGKELVKQINLYDGQEVKVVSPLGQDTPLGPVPRTKRFRVAGTFFTGMYEYDLKFIYVEMGALQDFLDVGDEVTGIEVRVEDPQSTAGVVAGLGEALGPAYRIQDWQELNRSLFSALKLEKIAMFLVLAIIILVASFSIVGNLIMVVIEKAREIAVLKTLGTSNVGIMKIFVTQGFFIGLVGTGIGVSLGLAASIAMQTFGLPLNPDVYYIDRLPIHIEPLNVALVFAAGIVISVVATLYPAYVAAGMRPVNGLRYE